MPAASARAANLADFNVVEVLIDLIEPGPLASGMKVDVYFRLDGPQRP
jgi:hypothetical protein